MSAGAAKAKQIGGVLLKVDGNRLQMITTATILLVCYFSSFYFYLSFLFLVMLDVFYFLIVWNRL